MALTRAPQFVSEGLDPALLRALEAVGSTYAPYDVELFSGVSGRARNPHSKHPHGGAIDLDLIDRATRRRLDNLGAGTPADIEAFQAYANEVYKWAVKNDPELAKELVWGGYFAGGGWPRDRMHFQRGGTMAGGSWAGGFDPEYVKAAGLSGAGGLGELDAAMKAAGYTPEQRRAAIASIESAGWKDPYRAKGPEADPAGHRALGRYQVMDYNVAPWAEQYLKMKGVTPEQFLADPKLQDQLFDAVFGDYVSKYGERGAASKWFTGSENEPAVTDVNGKLTGKTYADRYMEALAGTGAGSAAVAGAGAGAAGSASASPYALPAAAPKIDPREEVADAIGSAVAGIGGKANFDVPSAAATPASVSQAEPRAMFDPTAQQAQRERLAAALARLNQGQLWG